VYTKKKPKNKNDEGPIDRIIDKEGLYHCLNCKFCGYEASSKRNVKFSESDDDEDGIYEKARGSGPLINCNRCSFGYHQNCLSQSFAPLKVWKKTGIFNCSQCLRPTTCQICKQIDPPVRSTKVIVNESTPTEVAEHGSKDAVSETSGIPMHLSSAEPVESTESTLNTPIAQSVNYPSDIEKTPTLENTAVKEAQEVADGKDETMKDIDSMANENTHLSNAPPEAKEQEENLGSVKPKPFLGKFRCQRCNFVAHFNCMLNLYKMAHPNNSESDNWELIRLWHCHDCLKWTDNVEKALTFRMSNYPERTGKREFLVKFEGLSYLHVEWVPELWLKRVCPGKYRGGMSDMLESKPPPMEVAVPSSFTTIEKILQLSTHKGDVSHIYIKWEGLGHDCGK
jgi:transcription elongation factor Elf1